ncbi:hypothetical protein [Streptomyces sp. NPDC056600]|uniref:hypothetical protein n=1 Tax=Streptomyces sp. NPDC056600 TaxID=3345874 RepID=UPI00367A90DF
MRRGAAALLCAGLVVLGSPWVADPLMELPPDEPVPALLSRALLSVRWDLSPGPDEWDQAYSLAGRTFLVTMVVGIILLVPRVLGGAAPARVRWAAALGLAIALSLVASVVSWLSLLTRDGSTWVLGLGPEQVFLNFLVDGLLFGLLLGLFLAAVAAARPRSSAPVPDPAAHPVAPRFVRERSRQMRLSVLSSSAGLPGGVVAGGSVPGDATRYLCALAHLDPDFARRVVDGVLDDELGAVAPSPGVDLVPVVRHALAARRRHAALSRRLAAVWCLIGVLGPLWLLFAAFAFRALGAAPARGARRGRAARADLWSARGNELPDVRATLRGLVGTAAALLVVGVLLGLGLSALPLPGFAAWLVGGYLGGVPPLLAVVAGGLVAFRVLLRDEEELDVRLRASLLRDTFDPRSAPLPWPDPHLAARVEAVAEAQHGNVTVYSGFDPYVGWGSRDSQWAFSVPLLPASPGEAVDAFEAWDVVERLRVRLTETAGAAGAVVKDRVFLAGTELEGHADLLPDLMRAPAARLGPDAVRDIARTPAGPARHCLTAHVPLWGGEVVPSHLLHVSVADRTLHLRCERYVLAPVRRDAHEIDLRGAVPPELFRGTLLVRALRRTGGVPGGAVGSFLDHAFEGRRRARRLDRDRGAAVTDPAFDRGARLSVRELGQGGEYLNHFQRADAEEALASLDRHTLAAVRDFLDERGVSTEDFRSQAQTILNHGVLQTGGVSVVGNQAVGQGAQARAGTANAQAPGPRTGAGAATGSGAGPAGGAGGPARG